MDKNKLFKFISKRKTAILASVDGGGYSVVREMLAPRLIDGNDIYFSTNTSSNKVKHFLANNKACVYFYKRGCFKYQGVSIIGDVQVCYDQSAKDKIWRFGDTVFYKQGVTDPDYCVLKFTCKNAEFYCDMKIVSLEL